MWVILNENSSVIFINILIIWVPKHDLNNTIDRQYTS